jgi:hypothetical protein
MDLKKLNATIEEAERFLAKAKNLRAAMKREADLKKLKEKEAEKESKLHIWVSSLPAENGEVRRASMDLTRSLAQLRKY